MGIENIVIVDHICESDKWINMRDKNYMEYIGRDEFLDRLPEYAGKVTHVIHMGACSSTTEKNFDFLYKNNFEYTKKLWRFCAEEKISFIYASSAATYGDGSEGFDDRKDIKRLRPLNGYGYSKQLFDLWAEKQSIAPRQHVGFKFFNVYGPNEYYKGRMASVVFHAFNKIAKTGQMGLFKSYHPQYEDGGQMRDFIYVKDICKVVRFMMEHETVSGLFNLGTGRARSFYDLAQGVFRAMGLKADIKYVEMPDELKEKYQYYTQAEMKKLQQVGYKDQFYSLEDGIKEYVCQYLSKGYKAY